MSLFAPSTRADALPLPLILAFCLLTAPASADDPPDCGLYTYKAEIVRVIDGDTVVADIDLGFNVWLRDEHLRLEGIDAPERGSKAAMAATAALADQDEGRDVFICTTKAKRSEKEAKGSFGRYLVRIYRPDGLDLNEWLLRSDLVCPYVQDQKCQL